MKVGLIGKGFVGSALYKSFTKRGQPVTVYDKYQNEGTIQDMLGQEIVFFCLPTPYIEGFGYDLGPIIENMKALQLMGFEGLVVIKSTVEPGTCSRLEKQFGITVVHNPEFLTERTAYEDFDGQTHIVVGGCHRQREDYIRVSPSILTNFYRELYPDAEVSYCSAEESESMKIMCNNFYAMKVQIFNEFYMLCQRTGADYERVKKLMLKNGWINPMHTNVPGPDGKVSYGGHCFPKDTKALNHLMKTLGTPHKVLDACIEERDEMRESKLY